MVGQELQPQVAVFGLELGDIFRRQHAERGKRHIQQVAVLVLAVFQATFQCSGFLLHMEGLIIQVNIPAVRKAESQRVLIVLAKIHQSVHFLGGHVAGVQGGPGGILHLGTSGADPVIRPDAAQHFGGDLCPAAPRGNHELDPGFLHGAQGIDVFFGHARLPMGAQGAVNI